MLREPQVRRPHPFAQELESLALAAADLGHTARAGVRRYAAQGAIEKLHVFARVRIAKIGQIIGSDLVIVPLLHLGIF